MKSDLLVSREKALFILLVEHLSGTNNYVPVSELNQRYNANIPDHFLQDSFLHWEKEGLAKIYRTGTPLSARLRRESFGDAYERVVAAIGATTLTITPDLREVFSDVDVNENIPIPNGWKWFTLAREKSEPDNSPQQSVKEATQLKSPPIATSAPFQIVNNFTPTNTFAPNAALGKSLNISWAGWLGIVATVVGIIVTLWIAGKIKMPKGTNISSILSSLLFGEGLGMGVRR